MSILYRHALFITRKQPYLDWANQCTEDSTALTEELSQQQRNVYLVDEIDGEPVLEELVSDYWEEIFNRECESWILAEDRWPKSRTRALFDEWFAVELSATVFDLDPDAPMTQAEVDLDMLTHASSHCAMCGVEIDEGGGRLTGFKVRHRDELALFEGRVLPLAVEDGGVMMCLVPPRDSENAPEGDDLLVRVCSSGCEKGARRLVPKALRDWARRGHPDE